MTLSPDQSRRLFDAIRDIKGGSLTQAEVDKVNRALAEAPVPPAPSAPGTPRKVSQRGIDLIHSFESLKLTSYRDPGSRDGLPITCGWGTTVDEDGGPIPLGAVWTKEKADRLFLRDLLSFSRKVEALIGNAPTTQGQFDAMVSFAYNVGTGAFSSSTLLKLHKAGDYAGAKAQFARWNKNDGKVLNGLTRRRAAEAELYAS